MGRVVRRGLRPSRRDLLIGGAVSGMAMIGAPAILAQARKPIKLGILNTFSGASALPGESNWAGMSLYFDRINWTIAGRKVEAIKEDDEFNPQIGLQKARKFVDSDHVDLIGGPQGSNVALALLNYVKQVKAFLIVHGAGTDAVTWERNPYLFRTSLSTWQLCNPMAGWMYDNIAKEMVLSAGDYAGGRDVLREFRVAYLAKGGKVLKEIYPPIGTTDFSPYLADIRSVAPQATYNFFPGIDSVRWVQQYSQFGLKDKIPMAGFAGLVDATTIPAEGAAALGVLTSATYTDTLDNPENKSFFEEYKAKTGNIPDSYADYGFVFAQVVDEALKALDGDASNKDKLAEAMVKVSFNAPRGPFRFDPVTHNPIQNVYVCEAKQLPDRIAVSPIATVANVQAPPGKDG